MGITTSSMLGSRSFFCRWRRGREGGGEEGREGGMVHAATCEGKIQLIKGKAMIRYKFTTRKDSAALVAMRTADFSNRTVVQ